MENDCKRYEEGKMKLRIRSFFKTQIVQIHREPSEIYSIVFIKRKYFHRT